MIFTGDDINDIQELKNFLNLQFEMNDLGHLRYFLCLEITSSVDGFYLIQSKYISGLLSQDDLIDSNVVDTPIELHARLTPLCGELLSNFILYR